MWRSCWLFALPVTVLIGLYVVAHGQLSPGGGFQGGVVVATALHLLYLAVMALAAAAVALRASPRAVRPGWSLPLRRLHSGHVGDYVACALLGITLLGALLW